MALASTELLCTLPFAIYIMALNISVGLDPYKGWADLHFDYSRVDQIPAILWHLDHKLVIALQLSRWLVVACAFIFFCYFGFAEEARRHYRAAFSWATAFLPPIPNLPWRKIITPNTTRYGFHRSSIITAFLYCNFRIPKPLVLTSSNHLPVFISINTHSDQTSSFDASDDIEKQINTKSISSYTTPSPSSFTSFSSEESTDNYGHAY